jgi:putative DNA primase/helicase
MSPSLPFALIEFMHQQGYRPEPLKQSGDGFLRFPVCNESNGNTSGYVKLFPDGEGAVLGDFKSGARFIWSARDVTTLLPDERMAHKVALKKVSEEIKEERRQLHAAAAVKAAEIYACAGDAKADHSYLVTKCINPCGAIRQSGSQLFVPVYVEDKLTSLQFIEEDGTKRFLTNGEIKGGCCVLGTPGEVICIAEGYATGCSICEATGHAVAAAFNAGNLMHVAQAMRRRHKQATLILCADNDQWTEGNPGLTKAMEAATAVNALLAVPDFSACDMSSKPTDFNDLHGLVGKKAVSQAIAAAGRVDVGRACSHAEALPHLEADPTLEPINKTFAIDDQSPDLRSRTVAEAAAKSVTSETGMPMEEKDMTTQANGNNLNNIKQEDAPAPEDSGPLAPPSMPDAGFPPLMSDIVEAACDSSEAHPVAVAANVLAYFSAMIGRGVYQRIGDVVIHCRPFPLIVGKGGKARKGTSESTVRKIFKRADGIFSERRGVEEHLRCHTGGLSTGEGIAWAIRDPVEPDEKNRGSDPGVTDKRLLAIESEFDNVLSQLRRDSNTLSATIRNLFDGRDLEPLTKTSPTRATPASRVHTRSHHRP